MPRNEQTRTRQHGTRNTSPTTPEERIDAIRTVVAEKQYARIDGERADLFSCSAICAVYDKLSEEHRARYAALPFPRMAQIAFKLIR